MSLNTDQYIVAFRSGEWAEIMLSGDGDTDLDLRVYDENLKLVEVSNSSGDDEAVGWVPMWTGEYLIEVQNYGGVYNHYVLITN